jgi:hypothetical protein
LDRSRDNKPKLPIAMKKIFYLIAASLLTFIQSFAQEKPQQLLYGNKVKQYTFMKQAGTVLTVTGVVCMIAGLAKESNPSEYTGYGKPPSTSTNEVMGLMVGGVACLGTGIPLWTIGGYNQQKYQKKLKSISLQSSRGQKFKGLTLAYRF